MINLFVYFKAQPADRDGVQKGLNTIASAITAEFSCRCEFGRRVELDITSADEPLTARRVGSTPGQQADTWLEHYRLAELTELQPILKRLVSLVAETGLSRDIVGDRHIECFEAIRAEPATKQAPSCA